MRNRPAHNFQLPEKCRGKMKISKMQLKKIVNEQLVATSNKKHRLLNESHDVPGLESAPLQEGWLSGGLKGLLRSVPGLGNIAADGHTSAILDELDAKLNNIVKRLEALEQRR